MNTCLNMNLQTKKIELIGEEMDFKNINAENIFVTKGDLLKRMYRHQPFQGGFYVFKRDTEYFAKVVVEGKTLFRIYAANRDLYLYIRDLVDEVARALECDFRAEDWKDINENK